MKLLTDAGTVIRKAVASRLEVLAYKWLPLLTVAWLAIWIVFVPPPRKSKYGQSGEPEAVSRVLR